MLAVAQGKDGVGGGNVIHGDRLLLDVALAEGLDIVLVFLGVVMLRHGPVDGVVLQFESSEQVHGVGRCELC